MAHLRTEGAIVRRRAAGSLHQVLVLEAAMEVHLLGVMGVDLVQETEVDSAPEEGSVQVEAEEAKRLFRNICKL